MVVLLTIFTSCFIISLALFIPPRRQFEKNFKQEKLALAVLFDNLGSLGWAKFEENVLPPLSF